MEMTLNEYLAEVDRWKQTVSDRMAGLDASERARSDREAVAWLEEALGRQLGAGVAQSTHRPRKTEP